MTAPNAESVLAVHERCWCWQCGRCLTECPTADLPPPSPLTDANWHRAWLDLRAAQIDGSGAS